MQDLPSFDWILVGGGGHEHFTFGRAAAKGLPGAHQEAACDTLDRAIRLQPVVGAGTHQNGLLGRDTFEKRSSRSAASVVRDGGGHQVLMHGQRERGGSAVMSECFQERTYFAVRGTAAPELGRHERREDLAFLQEIVILGNEGVGLIAQSGVLGEARAELPHKRAQIDGVSHWQSLPSGTPENGRDQMPRQAALYAATSYMRGLRHEVRATRVRCPSVGPATASSPQQTTLASEFHSESALDWQAPDQLGRSAMTLTKVIEP